MLVDIEFKTLTDSKLVVVQEGDKTIITCPSNSKITPLTLAIREDVGIYWSRSSLFENFLALVSEWEEDKSYGGWPYFHFGGLSRVEKSDEIPFREKAQAMMASCDSYGVADNLQQIKEYAAEYWSSPRSFVLAICWVTKEGNPGWRWHKNGRYIGTQMRVGESLGQETNIERVLTFGFTEVARKTGEESE